MGFRGRKIRTTFSLHYDVIVVMKGAPTHIIKSVILQEMRFGHSRKRDVLTGIITSLLAQSHEPIMLLFWVRTFTD
jgi:NAD(P)H-hydrate repair Nnr-like enzyme with NAD(P)H-hydrate dehydratase domain